MKVFHSILTYFSTGANSSQEIKLNRNSILTIVNHVQFLHTCANYSPNPKQKFVTLSTLLLETHTKKCLILFQLLVLLCVLMWVSVTEKWISFFLENRREFAAAQVIELYQVDNDDYFLSEIWNDSVVLLCVCMCVQIFCKTQERRKGVKDYCRCCNFLIYV